MKKIYFFAAMAAVLSSCASDESFQINELTQGTPIELGVSNLNATRGNATGDAAATLLGNQFTAFGKKTIGTDVNDIFVVNPTPVKYSGGWSYTHPADVPNLGDPVQPLVYWDAAASQYDFYAFSDANKTSIVTPDADPYANGIVIASAIADSLAKVYVAPAVVKTAPYSSAVNFVFKNAAAKVRMAIYNAVPGYKIKVNKFYWSNDNGATYKGSTGAALMGTFYAEAGYTVDKDGTQALNGTASTTDSLVLGSKITAAAAIGTSVSTATFDSAGLYSWVLPTQTAGADIKLRINYTMISGADEITREVDVTVPAEFAKWEPNFAYTYFFKITDSDLDPIAFTAEVEQFEDFTQETITTVDGTKAANITTYVDGSAVLDDSDYKKDKTIEVRVTNVTATALEVLNNGSTSVDESGAKVLDFSGADDIKAAGNFTPTEAGYYVIRVTWNESGEDKYAYKVVKVVE